MTFLNTYEVWPVMLTPFTDAGSVDYDSLERLIDWYISNGANGLFAVCQSSELFYLSLKERVDIARFVKSKSSIPVIASGHVSDSIDDQADELRRIIDTGVDAVIMITNRLAREDEASGVWMKNLDTLLCRLDDKAALGFYECPYPYKRLLTEEELTYCAASGRFRFLKDTCCDIDTIKRRLGIIAGSALKLYNANTATLLESLKAGAAGFSGVMANFHPELYSWLMNNFKTEPHKAEILQNILTMCSQIEKQLYPVNAKYFLKQAEVINSCYTRSKDCSGLIPLYIDEIGQMSDMIEWVKVTLGITSVSRGGR